MKLEVSTAWKLAYVGSTLALLSFGTLNMISSTVKNPYLWGAETNAPKPTFSFTGVRKETFQRDAVEWFNQNWGLRGHAVVADNTVNASVFGETRLGQMLIIGKRGVLFSTDDIAYNNRRDTPDATILFARRVTALQTRLLRRDILVMPIIVPAKTTFHRDAVPDRWKRPGWYAHTDETLYGAFVNTLREENAVFVDGRELLTREFKDPELAFGRTGRHWRRGLACRALQAAIEAARPYRPELGNDNINCALHVETKADVGDDDFDLHRLLNVWASASPVPGQTVDILDAPAQPDTLQVPTLFNGTSFEWQLVWVTNRFEVLRPGLFYYYDKSVWEFGPLRETRKVEPNSERWRTETFSKKLIILDFLETYLPLHGVNILMEMEAELDRLEALESKPSD